MDQNKKVDNEDSIHMKIEIDGQKGDIWLSSIYGSYNYSTKIDLHNGEVASFSCPHCNSLITSDTECMSCGSQMIPFHLDIGGKVSICSRVGCKNHFVEFNDLGVALRRLYQEYSLSGKDTLKRTPPKNIDTEDISEEEAAREIIETGTFLHTYCPHCNKSLIEEDMLKLRIENGESGILMLSPYLNVFTSKSTIVLPEEKTVSDLKCFHCNKTLIVEDKNCEKCGSPIAGIHVVARTKLIDFYICTRKGCRWHGLNESDLYDIKLESSLEW